MLQTGVRVLVVALGLTAGCKPESVSSRLPTSALVRDLELTAQQESYLGKLAAQADAEPSAFANRKASGMAHMRFTLSGVLSLRDRAESDLEAAFELDPTDPELTRSLGRFYNLRAVAGDDTKAAKQVEVYHALLGDKHPAQLATREFVAWSFSQLGVVLAQRNAKRMLAALSTVKALESELGRRAEENPDDIELWALAGNFSFFFAGNIPFGKEARVAAGVRYFEHVRQHWAKLRAGARDPEHCPNTYENFMFELAEGYLVLEEVESAVAIYRELSVPSKPVTRAKEQIAFVSAERTKNAAAYAGELDLMPPWPSDVGNCVVCHAYTSDVPLTTLHVLEPLSLADIPTSAVPKPVPRVGTIPPEVRSVLDGACLPCHRPQGEAASYADFASDEGVFSHARAIERRVRGGEMPPTGGLSSVDRELLLGWLATP